MAGRTENFDVVVIGGGPAGVIAAVTARASYPDRSVALVRDLERVLIPCGIPYILHHLGGKVERDVMPDAPLEKAGVRLIVDRAQSIDRQAGTVQLASGLQLKYERLVLATGSRPVVPPIPGAELGNVFTVSKRPDELQKLVQAAASARRVLVVGAGFIGMEVADELVQAGKEITLVEMSPQVLPGAFDDDIAAVAARELTSRGVRILTGRRIERLEGDDVVKRAVLDDGTEVDAELAIMAVGYRPNAELATAAGLETGPHGALVVDEYMRTSDPRIFAAGDVAGTVSFLTRKPTRIMLAATAVSEARVAGMNLFTIRVIRSFRGTIGIFSTVLGNLCFASAGITEQQARAENIAFVVGRAEAPDRHPGSLPGARRIHVKLKVAASSGVVIGAQMYGGAGVGELINLAGLAIQNAMRADELMTAQIGTHPRLTSAPTTYPLIKAAEDAWSRMV